jgi:hypothetical protein
MGAPMASDMLSVLSGFFFVRIIGIPDEVSHHGERSYGH